MTDTSGSLDDERAGIADGITHFISQLPSDLHYHIGVMLGHGSTSNHSGVLWHHSNDAVTMDSDRMSLRQIQTHLRVALTTGPDDSDSDGGEESLYSFNKGITDKLSDNRSKGIFRDNAALAVIFITDENDICYPGTVPDPDHKEIPAYIRDCKNITAEKVLANVRRLMGNRPFLLSGIVYTDDKTTPKVGENEIARGILDLIKLSNGAAADIGRGHFEESLAAIGKMTTSKLMLRTEFVLGHTMVDPTSIMVKVDGKSVPFTFVPATNEVQLRASDAGSYGSVVSIYYCVKPGSMPTPQPNPQPPNPQPTGTPPGEGDKCDNDDHDKDWDKDWDRDRDRHRHKHKHKDHDRDRDDDRDKDRDRDRDHDRNH